ncbi:MAG: hypothetical protein ACRD0P_02830 [Stackebrandtia sp.]
MSANRPQLLAKAQEVTNVLLEAREKEGLTFWEQLDPGKGIGTQVFCRPWESVEQNTGKSPHTYQGILTSLWQIDKPDDGSATFQGFKEEVANTRRAVSHWDSNASRGFERNFLNAYDDIAGNQKQMLKSLLSAVGGYKKALQKSFSNIDTVLNQTRAAAQKIIDESEAAAEDFALDTLSVSISLAGAFLTGGPVGVGVALAGAGVTVAGNIDLENPLQLGGSKVEEVGRNFTKAMSQIKHQLDTFDGELAAAMKDDLATLTHKKPIEYGHKELEFVLPRPDIADNPSKL